MVNCVFSCSVFLTGCMEKGAGKGFIKLIGIQCGKRCNIRLALHIEPVGTVVVIC